MKFAVIYIIYLTFVFVRHAIIGMNYCCACATRVLTAPFEWPSHNSLIIKFDINDNVATTV